MTSNSETPTTRKRAPRKSDAEFKAEEDARKAEGAAFRKALTPKERRNETTHPDGAAAVAFSGCPQCKARKGHNCIRHDGERTNYVHSPRFKKWEASL